MVALKVHDIALSGTVASRAIVMQRKTQRPVQFEITDQTREALAAWIDAAGLRAWILSFSETDYAWS